MYDDAAILSLQYQHTVPSSYFSEIKSFVRSCDENHFTINVKKKGNGAGPKIIRGSYSTVYPWGKNQPSQLLQVSCWYPSWSPFQWAGSCWLPVFSSPAKTYFLRRLRVFDVNQTFMFLFYQVELESILANYGEVEATNEWMNDSLSVFQAAQLPVFCSITLLCWLYTTT